MSSWIQEVSESDCRTSYEVNEILVSCSTDACESVQIAESEVYGRMLFLDGELQSTSADEHIYHETLVHPLLASIPPSSYHHDAGLRVLVVGGGEGATVREVVKWAPEHVDWVDIDEELVLLCEERLGYATGLRNHQAVTYHAADIRVVLPTLGTYDAIILDLPDPDGDTGYLYSEDFWTDLRSHLSETGRLVTHCGPVRPFGSIGAGFQRILNVEAMPFDVSGFYTQSIPSFQGEWGFWMWCPEADGPFRFVDRPFVPPERARVADRAQILAWASPSLVWRTAVASATAGDE